MLQPRVEERLRDLSGQFLILTHRTRKEALQIVNKAGGFQYFAKSVVAAEDIVRAALLTGQIFSLFRYGIQKRLYLRLAERKYGIEAKRFAILDDNPANVDGILAGGGGLGLLAPKPRITNCEVTTFDLDAALGKYKSFRSGKMPDRQRIKLAANRKYQLSNLKKFHLVRARQINYIRRGAKMMRSILFQK